MISSLCSFLRADSESAMIINKTNFSYLLQAISVFCQQKHPRAIGVTKLLKSHVKTRSFSIGYRKRKQKKYIISYKTSVG